MADLAVNIPSMVLVRGRVLPVVFGEAVQHGAPVYRDLEDGGRWKNSSAALAGRTTVNGIAWSYGSRDQIGAVVVPEDTAENDTAYLSLGGPVAQGTQYVVSRNGGRISPVEDLTSVDTLSLVGVGDNGVNLNVRFHNTGVTSLGTGGQYQAPWDVPANNPDLAGTAPHTHGDYWVVSVAGTRTLGDLTNQAWEVDDIAMWRDDVSGNWERIPAMVPPVAGVMLWGPTGNQRDGVVLPEAGDYDGLYDPDGSADAVQANLTTHESNVSNPHNVTAAQAGADPAGSAAAVQANLDTHEAATNPHVTAIWRGYHQDGATYQPQDMVNDEGYLCTCRNTTTDPAAPRPLGEQYSVLELAGTPSWSEQSASASALVYGQRYAPLTQAAFVEAVKMYLPDEVIGFTAELWAVLDPLGTPDYQVLVPSFNIEANDTEGQNPDGITIQIGKTLVFPGVTFDVVAIIRPATGETSFTYEWDYKRSGGNPSDGEINHQGGSNQDQMRVHQNDKDDVNRSSDLDNIGPGSKILMVASGQQWDVLSASKSGSVYTFIVQPATRAQEDSSNFTFTYFSTLPIQYEIATNHFSASPSVDGFLSTTGYDPGAITLNDNAYGVDILIRDVQMSGDWEIMMMP